jgi:hypothetical protein
MKVAFDLDGTLIRSNYDFQTEKPEKKLFAKLFKVQELRIGTTEIFEYCKQQNWETWVYTTSTRSTFQIRTLFWLYNIHLNGIVNQQIHSKKVNIGSSKYPPSFGIDVIIDDSKGVEIEGERFNFETILINPESENWVEEIKLKLNHLKDKKNN